MQHEATTRPFGIYLHFPWCTVRCPYCDFAVATDRQVPEERYTRAVLAELEFRAPAFAGLAPRSLYLGGGTPSLWAPEWVAEVVAAVRTRLGLSREAEVTLEANPESCHPDRLTDYRAAGVNRFSIGVQSFDPGVLVKLGRRHGPQEGERAILAAARAVKNVAVDLIYGARRSSLDTARADAERVVRLPVTHVSAYALTVDPEVLAEEVPFARMRRLGRLPLPSDEEVVAQARVLRRVLRAGGLRRYEISNFARSGFESTHNRLYWESESYLGLGVGAFGCLYSRDPTGAARAQRYSNHRLPARYLAAVEAGELPSAGEEMLGSRELKLERIMLSLRTRRGLEVEQIEPAQRPEIEALERAGLLARLGDRIALTARGMDLHSAVVERLTPRE
ncbi:MAG TPA: radical SAM family heme chaperone HemW [Anaeromyxobacteraceae bacterium]|nr:radical SAM family heme chaperone HemW [Anaeromyxobacteraceae bacterium]